MLLSLRNVISTLASESERSSSPPREPGSKVGDALVLVRPIGRGAMGEVWLARHEKLKHEVAIKFLLSGGGGGTLATQQLERFRLEGQVAARLAGLSRHIVAVHDTGHTPAGEPYLVMEYVRGTTLERWIDERGPLPAEHVATIVEQVAEVLEIAHARGVLHRDLKPANVMLVGKPGDSPDVKVADFGVAKVLARDHDLDAPTPTREGLLVGSPAYMSPEQLTGATEPGPDADLWALSVMAYEALTGWAPFTGHSLSELTVAICRKSHERVAVHDATLPSGLDAFFERALAKRVEDRFEDAGQLAAAFRRALRSATARPAPPARRRLPRVLALAALTLAIGLGVIAWRSVDGRSAPVDEASAPPAALTRGEPAAPARLDTRASTAPDPTTTDPTADVAPEAPPAVDPSAAVSKPAVPEPPRTASPAAPAALSPPATVVPPPAVSATAKPFDESETL